MIQNNIVENIYFTSENHYLRPEYPRIFNEDFGKIVKLLLSGENVFYKETLPNAISVGGHELTRIFKKSGKLPLNFTQPLGGQLIPGEYITFNMKISGRTLTSSEIEYILDICRRSKYPIVLTAERKISDCTEYKLLPDHVSIYEKFVSVLTNIVDKTYEETCVQNTSEIFLRNCNIYKYSKYNICINSSGGLGMLSWFGNIIGLTTGYSPWDDAIDYSGSNIVSDIMIFLKVLEEKIC